VLTSAYVGQKQWDLAKGVAAEVKRIDPSFSVTRFASGQPYRDISLVEKFVSDLQPAGLPT
jgi:hypothetical protein